MSNYVFLFDLDSTITRQEILPEISSLIGVEDEMRLLTEKTMSGEMTFRDSFLNRVKMLSGIDVETVDKMIAQIPLNEEIVRFIKENRERCFIVTGNLNVWIESLMKKLGMEGHCYSSRADVCDRKISKVVSILDKGKQVQQFVMPAVAIGDGSNDAEMAEIAEIGIGFGGVREIAPSLLKNADYAFYDEECLVNFLRRLL